MTYDDEIILVGKIVTADAECIQRETEERTTILCSEKSVSRSEFFGAGSVGLKVEHVVVVHKFEYSGQETAIYKDKTLAVLRTYGTGDEIELVLGGKVGA